MITYDEVLNMNYYWKAGYTGWTGGMRFLIGREENEEGAPVFHAYVWPGPYIFDKVADDKKFDRVFPFTEDGRKQAVDWLNDQLAKKADLWPKQKTAGVWD